MAAGGTWDKTGTKERAGTYINFESVRRDTLGGGERGTVLLPLADTDYGPAKKWIAVTAAAPDAAMALFGHSIYEENDNMLLIREALKGAGTVLAYLCTEGKTAAFGSGGGLNATARYKGSRGNRLTYMAAANPLGGFDVEIYLDKTRVSLYEGIQSAKELDGDPYIVFSEDAENETALSETAGVTLTGGEDAKTEHADVMDFLDEAGIKKGWQTMAFPFTDESMQAALRSKIRYLREETGTYVQAAAPNFAADYEGIINVANSYVTGDKALTAAQATAYVAGITAGADNVQSNTNRIVENASDIVGELDHEAIVAALKAGKFVFSKSEEDQIVVENDINSLVTLSDTKDKTYRKNRVIRVLDSIGNSVKENFPPNRFDNDPDGWDIMEGLGKSILKLYGPRSDGGTGAIRDVDYDNDFLVDREKSNGDTTFFCIAVTPVDSAEKLYFTIETR